MDVLFYFLSLHFFIYWLRRIYSDKNFPDSLVQQLQFYVIDLEEYVKEYKPIRATQEIEQEIQMIQNAIDFKNVKLRDCMVPRTEIEALEINDDIDTLRNLFIETGHSKIMIFKNTIDHLVGYVHSYDLFTKPDKH